MTKGKKVRRLQQLYNGLKRANVGIIYLTRGRRGRFIDNSMLSSVSFRKIATFRRGVNRFSIPSGVIAFGYAFPWEGDGSWWKFRLIRAVDTSLERKRKRLAKRRGRFRFADPYACPPPLGTIDRPMDRLSCNLLVESRVWRNGVVAQFRGWRTTARAQWKINLNLTRFHTARCIIGGVGWRGWDEASPSPPQDLRRRKVEGFGKFGRNNIRGWNELWSVIRWLMVRLEFHEALVERDVRHCLRKITYLLFLLLRMDLCVFSSLWHLQGEGVSSRREF